MEWIVEDVSQLTVRHSAAEAHGIPLQVEPVESEASIRFLSFMKILWEDGLVWKDRLRLARPDTLVVLENPSAVHEISLRVKLWRLKLHSLTVNSSVVGHG